MTTLTWITTVFSCVTASCLMATADSFADGFAKAISAGIVIGLVNLGIHELHWRHKKKKG